MKKLVPVMALALLLSACVGGKQNPSVDTNRISTADESYMIDGKSVPAAEFNRFQKALKEVPGTWFCAEMKDGGETGFDAKNRLGTVYQVRLRSENGKIRNSISMKTTR